VQAADAHGFGGLRGLRATMAARCADVGAASFVGVEEVFVFFERV